MEGGSAQRSSRWSDPWSYLLHRSIITAEGAKSCSKGHSKHFRRSCTNKLQVVLFATEIYDEDWRPAAQRAVLEIQDRLNRIEAESFGMK